MDFPISVFGRNRLLESGDIPSVAAAIRVSQEIFKVKRRKLVLEIPQVGCGGPRRIVAHT
jgi:hypothetical protein